MGVFSLVIPAASTVVTLTEAKNWLKVDISDDNTLITDLIKASEIFAQEFCNRQFLTATFDYSVECWNPQRIYIPKQGLTVVNSVKYFDTDDTEQTLAASVYGTDIKGVLGSIYLKTNQVWPELSTTVPFPITIQCVIGAANVAAVPDTVKTFIKMMTNDGWENREYHLEGVNVASSVRVNALAEYYLNTERISIAV